MRPIFSKRCTGSCPIDSYKNYLFLSLSEFLSVLCMFCCVCNLCAVFYCVINYTQFSCQLNSIYLFTLLIAKQYIIQTVFIKCCELYLCRLVFHPFLFLIALVFDILLVNLYICLLLEHDLIMNTHLYFNINNVK